MRIVIFGLSVSSAWGNGHATLWRGLIRALGDLGHQVVFFERDVPYYRAHRDLDRLPGRACLHLYDSWDDNGAAMALDNADAAIVTSYCPDGRRACELVLGSNVNARVFYDLDTPITLARLDGGSDVEYLPDGGLGGFDLVLSYTGGAALEALRDRLGARRVEPLYGSVDPSAHCPPPTRIGDRACSYLGTYAEDRQEVLDTLLFEPARRNPHKRFLLAGAKYPSDLAIPPNIERLEHVAPAEHPAFYASCPLTLSVTRGPMARLGYCPSGRLFEAAACGVPVLSDWWRGLESFFAPGEEILIARDADSAAAAIDRPASELAAIGRRARARVLAEHTAAHRAAQLVELLS